MNDQDIRWVQRFEYYSKALDTLTRIIEPASERELTEAEKLGTIKTFEFTFELAWETLKDFYDAQGDIIHGPQDTLRRAFNQDIISNGQTWMDMMDSCNQTAHTYNEGAVETIYQKIIDEYYGAFEELKEVLLNEKKRRGL